MRCFSLTLSLFSPLPFSRVLFSLPSYSLFDLQSPVFPLVVQWRSTFFFHRLPRNPFAIARPPYPFSRTPRSPLPKTTPSCETFREAYTPPPKFHVLRFLSVPMRAFQPPFSPFPDTPIVSATSAFFIFLSSFAPPYYQSSF